MNLCQNISYLSYAPKKKKMGTNSSAVFAAETLVTLLCNSMHVAAELVRSKHIPVMPKQALLTAAHFSCALKFNSMPTYPVESLPPSSLLLTATPLPSQNRGSLLTSVISNKSHLILCLLLVRHRDLLYATGAQFGA